MKYFLTTTPNQANFIGNGIAPYHAGFTIHIDESTGPYDYQKLSEVCSQFGAEVWFPYQDCPISAYCVQKLSLERPDLKLVGYYESLISYFVRPWLESLVAEQDVTESTRQAIQSFVGIVELDNAFQRTSHPVAPKFSKVYPRGDMSTPELERSQGIFIGQPLATYGTMEAAVYKNMLDVLITTGKIDTYIMHPREKECPHPALVCHRLQSSVENYRGILSEKPIYNVFSTSSAYFSAFYQNVIIVSMPRHLFNMSPWAHDVYQWLQKTNPTVKI